MIGLAGVAGPRRDPQGLGSLATDLEGSILDDTIRFSKHVCQNAAVRCYDEDLEGGFAELDDITVFIVGDLYTDAFSSSAADRATFLLELYRKQGPAACAALDGAFAFLIVDQRERAVHLGTDQNSCIPLYYAVIDGVLHFSWDVSRILAAMPTRIELDEEHLFAWLLVGGRGFADRTRYRGVRRLEPGSVATLQKNSDEVSISHLQPFAFAADDASEETLLDQAAAALGSAVRRQVKDRNKLAIGLTGGLDSRLLLAIAKSEFAGDWYSYTYGRNGHVDSQIAKLVAEHFAIPHQSVVIGDELYIEHAADGVFYTGGASLFKMGIQPPMYAAMKKHIGNDGLLIGSALDLILGSTFSPEAVHQLKHRSQLMDYYRKALPNVSAETFTGLFEDRAKGKLFIDSTFALIEDGLSRIAGDNPVDVNDAFAFDVRIKRWYNHNMVVSLYSHRLLNPTYDHDFLDVVSKVPHHLRRDSLFRTKLLTHVDPAAAEIPCDSTLQPASLLPPHTLGFRELLAEMDRRRQSIWFESEHKTYLPSDRYEANFLEWLRVYPRYRAFADDLLTGKDAVLADIYFDRNALGGLIDRHVEGTETNHQLITMLMSAELMARQAMGSHDGVHYQIADFPYLFERNPS